MHLKGVLQCIEGTMRKRYYWLGNPRKLKLFLVILILLLSPLIYLHSSSLPFIVRFDSAYVFLPQTSRSKVQVQHQVHSQNRIGNISNSSLPPISVFFHIYVPRDEVANTKQQKRATVILRNQLQILNDAFATVPNMEPVHLYYTTIGKPLEKDFMERICNKHNNSFICHHLQHLDEGFEESSLAALHDYCVQHENDRVIYIHTKGSFHSNPKQALWRNHMTDAVGSRDCIERAHQEECDICGLLFLPRPSLHLTGNMFNAKCSYIRKLLNPFQFQREMEALDIKARQWIDDGILQANLLNISLPWYAGIQRYSMEHWPGSHPSVQACDVSSRSEISFWQYTEATDLNPGDWQFAAFPRHPVTDGWSILSGKTISELLRNESARLQEFFLLPGQLFKWFGIYGEVPPPSSWVWKWYPDGEFWYSQVEQYGREAIVEVAKQLQQDPSPILRAVATQTVEESD